MALGTADATLRARADDHLDRCEDCRTLVSELTRLFGSVAPAVGPSASPSWAYHATLPVRPASLPPPSLGRYQLGQRLGEGGMGVVYQAYDPELDRQVAIKLLHPDPDVDVSEHRARLLREAQAMARLNHPNVVAVYDVGAVGAQVFVAVELIAGSTLRRWLETPRTLAEILRVFVEAGRGLAAAHDQGLVHRDFKPDNVLVGADGRARVTDFGLARRTDGAAPHGAAVHTTFALAGTPAYMAPEQFRGEATDARTDQFAFAVALYEAVLRSRPFEGEALGALARNVVEGRLRTPGGAAPRWLRGVLVRALSRRREDRFPSMQALLGELERDRGRPLRIGSFVGAAGLGVTGLVLVFRAFLQPPPTGIPTTVASAGPVLEGCGVDEVGARFGKEQRAALEKAAAKVNATVAPTLVAELGRWADALAASRGAACKAHPRLPPHEAACFDDRLRLLEAFAGAAGRASASGVALGLERLHYLPDPASCRDAGDPFPVPSADAGVTFGKHRDRLAAGWAALAFGLDDDAQQAVDDVVAATPDKLSLAEVHLLAGERLLTRDDALPAKEAFETALATAREAKHRALAHRAARGLLEAAGVRLLLKVDEPLRLLSDLAPKGELPGAHKNLLEARLALAQGKTESAKDALEDTLAGEKALEGHAVHVDTLVTLADAFLVLDDPGRAETRAKQALAAAKLRAGDPRATLRAAIVMARTELALGKPTDAAERLIPFRKKSYEHFDLHDPLLAAVDDVIGLAREAEGKLPEARKEYEHELFVLTGIRAEHPLAARPWTRLARLSVKEGKDGRPEAEKAATLAAAAFGAESPAAVDALRALAVARAAKKDQVGALAALTTANDLVENQFGFVAPLAGDVAEERGLVLTAFGQWKDALTAHDDALLPLQARYGMHAMAVVQNLLRRADLAARLGDDEYAQRLYGVALPDLEARLGETSAEVLALRKKLKKP
ncbi:MAG: serine/threonine protein kinase [Verrucomicrobia bacterium]|nr:serine/threonine protein kinase [Verrucomicrobiota bacterium]